ncbi:hypothetical protein ACHWQZ_G013128 [Mnemiopsis leidyi]
MSSISLSLFLFLLSTVAMPTTGVVRSGGRMKSLKFASGGYINFVPDWSPMVSVFSVCGWVKETGSSSYPHFFHYYASSSEIIMAADGEMYIHGSRSDWASSASISTNRWYHICTTWSAASRAFRYYVDARLVGTKTTTSGRFMKTGGDITIGKNRGTSSATYMFTGEIAYLNVYAKELTITEITAIVRGGMCANLAHQDPLEPYREIKWEALVQIARSGSVTDVYLEDCITDMYNNLARLSTTKGEHNATAEKLEAVLAEKAALETRHNATTERLDGVLAKKAALETRLNSTTEQLEAVLAEKAALKTRLNTTLVELEKVTRNLNITWDWDVFLSDQFINKTFSTEHSELLRSTWDGIAERLIGIRISEEFIELLDHIDPDTAVSSVDYMLYSENYFDEVFTKEMAFQLMSVWEGISEKMVGITFTKKIIKLLDYVTVKSNCGN